jgi:hypothetical protein
MPETKSDRAANELREIVRWMIAEWETSDDLASDLAGRIVVVARQKLCDEPFCDAISP